MQKLFIIGGAGFIGRAVARYALGQGVQVRTFDVVEPKEKLGEHVAGSILDPEALQKAMQTCDAVVHLAALTGVKRTEEDRLGCLDLNILGTKNVLDACVRNGVSRMVFASSAEVYGEAQKSPIAETDPLCPKSLYGITKLAGEEYVRAEQKQHGLDFSIARFFNIYGPDQVPEFVLPKFIQAVLGGSQITITGTGEQMRSFCYVDDAARAIYLMLTSEKASGEVFNIANDKAVVSIKELAEKVTKLCGKNVPVKFVVDEQVHAVRGPDRMQNMPDITKASSMLGFEPKVSLDEGIASVIEAMKEKQ